MNSVATPPISPAQNPLAQLRDIHLPEPISWWPLAPGLWVALIIVIAALLIAAWLLYKRHNKNCYRRQALKQVDQFVADYQRHQQQQTLCQQLLSTLRRCLLSGNRHKVPGAVNQSAAELLQQLNHSLGKPLFPAPLCEQVQLLAYAAKPTPLSDSQIDELLRGARTSIRKLP